MARTDRGRDSWRLFLSACWLPLSSLRIATEPAQGIAGALQHRTDDRPVHLMPERHHGRLRDGVEDSRARVRLVVLLHDGDSDASEHGRTMEAARGEAVGVPGFNDERGTACGEATGQRLRRAAGGG